MKGVNHAGRPVCRLGGEVMLTLIYEKENVRTWSAYKQLRVASLAAFCDSGYGVLYTARLLLPSYLIHFVKVLSHKL
jgi:hypothetical protein